MTSLADKLQNRHLGEAKEEPIKEKPGSDESGGGRPGFSTPPVEDTDLSHTDNVDSFLTDSIPVVQERKPSVVLADLPQLKGSSSSGSATTSPRKWGALDLPSGERLGTAVASASEAEVSKESLNGKSSSGLKVGKSSPVPGDEAVAQGTQSSQRTQPNQVVISTLIQVPADREAVSVSIKKVSASVKVKIETSKSAFPNKLTFMIRGASLQDVEEAQSQLAANLAPKVNGELLIPASSRSALIGVRGSNLRALEKKHGTSIDLKQAPKHNWSLERTLVFIEGTSTAVQAASQDILSFVDNTKQVSSSRSFPNELRLFLAQLPDWSQYVHSKLPKISLAGNLAFVTSGMTAVDSLISQMQKDFVTIDPVESSSEISSIQVPEDLLFEQYGVAVIPGNKLYGPDDRVKKAKAALQNYLKTQTVTKLDISQAHGRDISHAKMLTRYFAATGTIADIAAKHNVAISEPIVEEGSVFYTFSGDEKAAAQARKALVQQVSSHGPSSMTVVRGMRHSVIRKQALISIKSLEGPVSTIMGPSDELFIAYKEPEDDFRPSDIQVKQHVETAAAQLASLTELAKKMIKKSVNVGENCAQLIVNPVGPEATQIFSEVFGNNDNIEIEKENANTILLSGTKSAVADAAESLQKILQSSRNYLLRASYVDEFKIDANVVRNVIGKNGHFVQSLRKKYDVKLDIEESGLVRVRGIEAQVKACSKEISDMQKRLRDEATETLSIPSEFHAKLIGPKGKHVKRLREQHQCIIRFPKVQQQEAVDSPNSSEEDQSLENSTSSTPPNSEDAIFIKGPSRGVAAIKKEFLDLVSFERSQSYSNTISVSSSIVPRLVGRNGVTINNIRLLTGAHIDVGSSIASKDDGDAVDIVITGEQKAVSEASKKIQEAVEAQMDLTETSIEVPFEFHRLLMGPQNVIRRELVASAGGDPEQASRILIVPPSGSGSSTVKLIGSSKVIAKLHESVQAIVSNATKRSQFSSTLKVPRDRLRFVLGSGGSKRKESEEKYNVFIQIPKDSQSSSHNEKVELLIQGESDDQVAKAIDHLRRLTLPHDMVCEVSSPLWSPKLRSQCFTKFGVKVEALPALKSSLFKEPEPPKDDIDFLITPIKERVSLQIMGEDEYQCQKAFSYLTNIGNADTVGYLWIPSSKIKSVIGVGGKVINKVREQSQCTIEVPTVVGESTKPVVVIGELKQVKVAIDLLKTASQKP